jgi:hypothetical protein
MSKVLPLNDSKPSIEVFEQIKHLIVSLVPVSLLSKKRKSPDQEDLYKDRLAARCFFSKPKVVLNLPPIQQRFDLLNTPFYLPVSKYSIENVKERQGSEYWKQMRKRWATGSTLTDRCGLWGLHKLQASLIEGYDMQRNRLKNPPPEEDSIMNEKKIECMAWGSNNEIHTIATVIKYICNNRYVVRAPCQRSIRFGTKHINTIHTWFRSKAKREFRDEQEQKDWETFIRISPDMEFVSYQNNTIGEEVLFVGEIKWKYGDRTPCVYESPPWWYYLQTQAEIMTTQNAPFCLFVSGSPHQVVMWKLPRDESIWDLALPILLESHWNGLNQIMPNVLPQGIDSLRQACIRGMNNMIVVGCFDTVFSRQTSQELEEFDQQRYQEYLLAKSKSVQATTTTTS